MQVRWTAGDPVKVLDHNNNLVYEGVVLYCSLTATGRWICIQLTGDGVGRRWAPEQVVVPVRKALPLKESKK
jgi:hypothetical protein